ncbi:hypothetical protein CK203_102420 [Vitis vinifera]|uniref:DUF659 domain-containing protein n=1 Tax=Vitis vinifera TaxID=29760 RepID=A0A438D9H3_VITVI|nr:hypothetical protein CK203_102420 [Vitis vinifera]
MVIQIVTDNGSAFVTAAKLLMKKFNLYWNLCAAHYIDLIFKDIGKKPSVTDMINNARKITNFIYNHGWLLAQMRKYCGGDIVQLGITRHGVGSNSELLQVVHNVFAKLDPTTESFGQFGSKLVFFQDAKREFDDQAAIVPRSTMVPATLNSHQEVDSTSVGHSSRPSAIGTSASGYDGSRGGIDDGDHGSRRVGSSIRAIGKPYKGRERTVKPYSEELLSGSYESMSIGTQFNDFSNEANVYPSHVMSYGQSSSSIDEEYGMSRCSPSAQISYQVLYQMERGFEIKTWGTLSILSM